MDDVKQRTIADMQGAARLHGASTDDKPVPRLAVAGDAQKMGTTFGNATRDDIRKLNPIFTTLAVGLSGQNKAMLRRRAAKIEPHIQPEDIAEMKAIAAAAGIAYEDVLLLNLFYTLTNRHTIGCRQLVAWADQTADGELIHGRNLDWLDYPGKPLHQHHLIVDVKPKGGHRYLTLTWPGLVGVLTGTNEHGLTVAYNQLPGGNSIDRLAEPVFFVLRRILRTCKDIDSAVAQIKKAKPLDDGSIMISDARAKRAVVVEVIDGRVGVRQPRKNEPMIGNANHCTDEANVRGFTWVPRRRASWPTVDVARNLRGPIDADTMRTVLADRRVLQSINIQSIVFEPSENRMIMSIATGHAAKGRFVEYRLFPDRSKPAPAPAETGHVSN